MIRLPDTIDRNACAALDAEDPLASFRERFVMDGSAIYLDGNSLGRLPKATVERVGELVRSEWGVALVRGWLDHGWMDSPLTVGDSIAKLIGAGDGEVLVTDSTSVDLFKLVAAVLEARPERRVVLTESGNFPTDLYVADHAVALLGGGRELRRVARDEIAHALSSDTALLLLTHVDFRTGSRHDMAALTEAAHAVGALVLWDLSHSAGAVSLHIGRDGVDLATGCGYKYLNGGPGSPAYLYVARRLQDELRNPIQGWLGHENPFTYSPDYHPAPGIRSWMSGSPPVVAIASLGVGVSMHLEATPDGVGEKAAALTGLFIRLAEQRLAALGFSVATPPEAERRGAQVSLRHADAYAVMRALHEQDVIGDFRDPDYCRFGLAPLYTRFTDVWDAVERIARVVETGAHRRPELAERRRIN